MVTCEEAFANHASLLKQFNNCITNYKKANSDRKKSISFLKTRIDTITDLFKQIQKIYLLINTFKTEEVTAYNESDIFAQVDETFHDFTADWMEAIAKLTPANPGPSMISQTLPAQSTPSAPLNNDFRIPMINIPNFSGEYSAWHSFKNSFELLVAKNTKLTNLQRLHHLQNCVSGEAQSLIQHYGLIENNFQAAWD